MSERELRQAQGRIEQLLAACTRTLMPPAAGALPGACFACGRPPDARMSLRMDGVELYWLNACSCHHAAAYEVTLRAL